MSNTALESRVDIEGKPIITEYPDSVLQQYSPQDIVHNQNVSPDDFFDQVDLEIPPYAFKPDQWSRAFLRGLAKVDASNKALFEVGVGTGINAIYLLAHRTPHSISISDIDSRLVELAVRNVRKHIHDERKIEKLAPFYGASNLAERGLDYKGGFQIIFGCLPQVIIPEGKNISEGDNGSHYYERERYTSDLHLYGLGLIDVFLQQAFGILLRESKVVLNLSGRPGKEVLENLFKKNGFTPQVLHKEIIAQHAGTSLESLVVIEATAGRRFEFFADPEAKEPLTATQAEEKRLKGEQVFHYIYVYQGTR